MMVRPVVYVFFFSSSSNALRILQPGFVFEVSDDLCAKDVKQDRVIDRLHPNSGDHSMTECA